MGDRFSGAKAIIDEEAAQEEPSSRVQTPSVQRTPEPVVERSILSGYDGDRW